MAYCITCGQPQRNGRGESVLELERSLKQLESEQARLEGELQTVLLAQEKVRRKLERARPQ